MKTIGVLGLGAQATVDFEKRIHQASQRLIPPRATGGYPPMIVWHHRRPPILVNEDLSPVHPRQPDPKFLEAARWLGANADFLVITANGPHLFHKEVEHAAGRRLLSMIDVTLAEVRRRGWRRVGVLGFFDPQAPVYTEPMRAQGLAYETIDDEQQAKLNTAIFRLMEGRENDESRAAAREAVAALRAKGVDGVIPGCTEIPLLLRERADAPDLVNPAQILAEAAVKYAMVG